MNLVPGPPRSFCLAAKHRSCTLLCFLQHAHRDNTYFHVDVCTLGTHIWCFCDFFFKIPFFFELGHAIFFWEIYTVSVYTRGTSSLISTRREVNEEERKKRWQCAATQMVNAQVLRVPGIFWTSYKFQDKMAGIWGGCLDCISEKSSREDVYQRGAGLTALGAPSLHLRLPTEHLLTECLPTA